MLFPTRSFTNTLSFIVFWPFYPLWVSHFWHPQGSNVVASFYLVSSFSFRVSLLFASSRGPVLAILKATVTATVNNDDQEKTEDNTAASNQLEHRHQQSIKRHHRHPLASLPGTLLLALARRLHPPPPPGLPPFRPSSELPSPRSSPTAINGRLIVLEMKVGSKPRYGEAFAVRGGFVGCPRWDGEPHASRAGALSLSLYHIWRSVTTLPNNPHHHQ